MKYKIWMLFALLLFVQGCKNEDVYTLSKEEVKIEVHSKDFEPKEYLLKNEKALSREEMDEVKTGTAVDMSKVGEYTFRYPEHNLELKVIVEDTQKPKLSMIGFEIVEGEVFTWNDESFAKLKAQASDNYDDSTLLKKSLQCESVDTSKVGKQTIQCQIEDSSGNITKEPVEIEVKGSKK